MKKIFWLLLSLILVVMLCCCNTPADNAGTDTDSDTITTESEVYKETSSNTETQEEPSDGISVFASLEKLSQIKELIYYTDKEKTDSVLLQLGFSEIEEVLPFLDTVDSIPYIKLLGGEIARINYSNSTTDSYIILGITNENGDAVDFLYYLNAEEIEDPMAFAAEAGAHRGGSLFDEPKESQDKRLSIVSEQRENFLINGLENGIEWWGVLDGMAIRIVYRSENADNIKIEDVLNSLTITTIPKSDPIAPELMEQISEGMTYKEVKEIIGALRKDISTENIVFEYYLTDGRAAQIEFQKLNENDDLNDFTVKSITIE